MATFKNNGFAQTNSLTQFQATSLSNPNDEWARDVNDYHTCKTNFQGVPDPQPRKTMKEMKKLETLYNPILQKFTDGE